MKVLRATPSGYHQGERLHWAARGDGTANNAFPAQGDSEGRGGWEPQESIDINDVWHFIFLKFF